MADTDMEITAPIRLERDELSKIFAKKFEESLKNRGLKAKLACPFFVFLYEKYRGGQFGACAGAGFGSIEDLHKHVLQCHLPEEVVPATGKERLTGRPRMGLACYKAWEQKRQNYECRGEKQQPKKKWVETASHMLGCVIELEGDDDRHLTYPGAKFEDIEPFLRSLCHDPTCKRAIDEEHDKYIASSSPTTNITEKPCQFFTATDLLRPRADPGTDYFKSQETGESASGCDLSTTETLIGVGYTFSDDRWLHNIDEFLVWDDSNEPGLETHPCGTEMDVEPEASKSKREPDRANFPANKRARV